MPSGFFRIGRGMPSVIWVRALLPGAFFGAESFIPLMLVEQRALDLFLAGVMLTDRGRRVDGGVLVAVAVVGQGAARPADHCRHVIGEHRDRGLRRGGDLPAHTWFGTVGIGWLLAGFGMGLATASTSLAVMTLSPVDDQGRNAASLNLGDALGSSIFIGVSGSIFAALRSGGDLRGHVRGRDGRDGARGPARAAGLPADRVGRHGVPPLMRERPSTGQGTSAVQSRFGERVRNRLGRAEESSPSRQPCSYRAAGRELRACASALS